MPFNVKPIAARTGACRRSDGTRTHARSAIYIKALNPTRSATVSDEKVFRRLHLASDACTRPFRSRLAELLRAAYFTLWATALAAGPYCAVLNYA